MSTIETDTDVHDIVIAGAGIAGQTAAIYAARANRSPIVLMGDEPGGQLTLTTDVENFPGFPDGVGGFELVDQIKEQAAQFGTTFRSGSIIDADLDERPFELTLSDGETLRTMSLVVATGASARWVDAKNENELMGHGLSTCATCDGAFHRGDEVLIVGGGDSAMEEAIFLTKFAEKVFVAHRRDELRASEIMTQRAMENDDIEFLWNTELLELQGTPETGVTGTRLVRHPEGYPKDRYEDNDSTVEEFELDVGGVFYAIGHTPNTGFLEETRLELDEYGYLQTESGRTTETAVEGVFAAGDVTDDHYQQAVTAAGLGAMAAIDADEWLDEVAPEILTTTEAVPADD
ncbi:NAD(P)/FAD-dependent oxidoreductase [Haladaptatus sp. NG-SE-30]